LRLYRGSEGMGTFYGMDSVFSDSEGDAGVVGGGWKCEMTRVLWGDWIVGCVVAIARAGGGWLCCVVLYALEVSYLLGGYLPV
jgi:hypothetical protein